jgi:hypothetical protein
VRSKFIYTGLGAAVAAVGILLYQRFWTAPLPRETPVHESDGARLQADIEKLATTDDSGAVWYVYPNGENYFDGIQWERRQQGPLSQPRLGRSQHETEAQ